MLTTALSERMLPRTHFRRGWCKSGDGCPRAHIDMSCRGKEDPRPYNLFMCTHALTNTCNFEECSKHHSGRGFLGDHRPPLVANGRRYKVGLASGNNLVLYG